MAIVSGGLNLTNLNNLQNFSAVPGRREVSIGGGENVDGQPIPVLGLRNPGD